MNEENAVLGADSDSPCERDEARARLVAYLDSYDEVFLLAGPAASGKTTLVADVLKRLDSATPLFLLDAGKLTEAGVVSEVCDQLGLQTDALDWEQTLEQISARLTKYEHAFLVIDNAHELSAPDLDALRLLSYLRSGRGPQLQMILVGHDAMLDAIDDTEMLRLGLWHSRRAKLGAVADMTEPASPASEQPVAEDTVAADEDEKERPSVTLPAEADVRPDLAAMVVRPPVPPERVADSLHSSVAVEHWRQRIPAPGPWLVAVPVVLAVAYALFFSGGNEPVEQAEVLTVSNEVSTDASQNSPSPSPSPDALAVEAASTLAPPSPEVPTESVPGNVETVVEEPADIALQPLAQQPVAAAVEAPLDVSVVTETAGSDPGNEDEGSAAVLLAEPATPGEAAAVDEITPPDTIPELMAAAANALRLNRLRTPTETSAWTYYDQVLALSPDNAQALRGMQNIVRRYEELIRVAITREQFVTAQTFINRGLSVVPDDSGLLALQEELDRALEDLESGEDVAATAPTPAPAPEEAVAAAEEKPTEPGGFIGFLREVFSAEED